jgi:lysyl-tRNA synthetase class 2
VSDSSAATHPDQPSVSEQMQVRRDKRNRIIADGGQAYPVSVPRTHSLAQIREQWGHLVAGEETDVVVS